MKVNEKSYYNTLISFFRIISKQLGIFKLQIVNMIDSIKISGKENNLDQKKIKSLLHDLYILGCKISTCFDEMKNYIKKLKREKNLNSLDSCSTERKKKIKKKKGNKNNFFDLVNKIKYKNNIKEKDSVKFYDNILINKNSKENSNEIESLFKSLNFESLNSKEKKTNKKSNKKNQNKNFSEISKNSQVLDEDLFSVKLSNILNKKNKKKNFEKSRGNYKICSLTLKKEAIRIAQIKSIKEASLILKISEKNIKRWIKFGPERKKGAGRKKMDENMEKNLLKWIEKKFSENGIVPDNREIKIKAKLLSSIPYFKASKGWCDKFISRNQIFFNDLSK